MKARLGGGRPLYEVVRTTIEDRVANGTYTPDKPLPSVTALAAELGVSGITIRRALADLQNAGLLRSIPSLGTFVNATRRFVRHLNRVRDPHYGAFEEALHIGKTATAKTLSVELRDPQDPAFGRFMSDEGGSYICINKIICIDEEPMALEHTFVRMPVEQSFITELKDDLLYRVLRRRKLKLAQNRLYFESAPASPDLSEALGVPLGYPTIRHFYNPVLQSGALFICGVSISPFDRIAYAVDL
ncbi:MAG TPA: GntR family transcriptional regulator [Acetobacteraceae bacterium]|nr:GntR family transcriptional regulator [Acetobacteraceae bacterium]